MDYSIRQLELADLEDDSGFFDTLSNLSQVGNIDSAKKQEVFNKIKDNSFIFVAVSDDGQIIGSIKLLVEPKFAHGGANAGHIEDVVTRQGHEGKGIGKMLVKAALDKAKEADCYKVILDCQQDLVPFYAKSGFKEHEVCMRNDLN